MSSQIKSKSNKKDIKLGEPKKKRKKKKNPLFPSDPPHVNLEEYQGTDPTEEHHTQSVCHPHSLWQEPIA